MRWIFMEPSSPSCSSSLHLSSFPSFFVFPSCCCFLLGVVSVEGPSAACRFSASLFCASRFSARFFSLNLALVALRLARDSSMGRGTRPLRFLYKEKTETSHSRYDRLLNWSSLRARNPLCTPVTQHNTGAERKIARQSWERMARTLIQGFR